MKFLFIASLHHPDQDAPAGSQPLSDFPVSQAQHFWVKSLRRMGHECHVFWRSASALRGSQRPSLYMTDRRSPRNVVRGLLQAVPELNPDLRLRNRALRQFAERIEPDVIVMIGGNRVILPSTLNRLKEQSSAVLIYATGTSPRVFAHRIERSAAGQYDLVITNDSNHAKEWIDLGAPRAEVLPLSAVDPDFHRKRPLPAPDRDRFRRQIGFVGTLVPRSLYGHRVAALMALREFDLAIWSVHEVPLALQRFYRGPALGDAMMSALSGSTIAVNPHADFMLDGGNQRLFEACGAGALQITNACPAVDRWFQPGEHLLTYRDPDELVELVRYALENKTRLNQIAAAGQAHVYAHHTYDHRMRRLLELILMARRASVLDQSGSHAKRVTDLS
jgi:glycosyltransferase involved in cell wall biosynthesis